MAPGGRDMEGRGGDDLAWPVAGGGHGRMRPLLTLAMAVSLVGCDVDAGEILKEDGPSRA